ncbi:MAG TPA: VOC family protein [Gemmatimonadaceae bacterium]|nr:VOC family protein [Gemmatimonadaceae bacterium]
MHGQFIWYELMTPDPQGAIKFYPQFTGWGTQPFDENYTMWTTDGEPFAGLMKLTDEMRAGGAPPSWTAYVEVTNVDDTAALATSLGAKTIVPPTDIPNVGRFAIIQDPQGAVLAVFKSSAGMTGWDGTNVIGRFSWHELMCLDHTKAFEFYRRLFGWEKLDESDMGGGLMYLIFGKGKKMYGGMFTRTADMANMPPFWLLYVSVKNVPAALATATKAGGSVHRPPMDIPGGVIAIMGDPQGAGFALHHQNPEPAAAPKPAAKKVAAKKAPAKKAAAKKAPAKKKAAAKKKTVAAKRPAKKKTAKKAPKKAAPKKASKKSEKKKKKGKKKKGKNKK